MKALAAEGKPGSQVNIPVLIPVTQQAGLKVEDALIKANSRKEYRGVSGIEAAPDSEERERKCLACCKVMQKGRKKTA